MPAGRIRGMTDDRLPVKLWLDGVLKPLAGQGIYHYVHQEGDHVSGLVLLKLNNLEGLCKLLFQQRDFETDKLDWMPALHEEIVTESAADSYIARAMERDPDLWVIEIEDRKMGNPFDMAG